VLPIEWLRSGLPPELTGLNDSKQLSASSREKFYSALKGCAQVSCAIACVEADEIDRLNILQAAFKAMRRALDQLEPQPQQVLVDGSRIPALQLPQTALVKGDSRSYSIAAASILAKVTRDRLMLEYDQQYPAYGFARNKGYGTAEHVAALGKYGPCPIHRRSFAPVRSAQLDLFAGRD
jgi:ribonuclease HII